MTKQLILCNCAQSQTIDGKTIAAATGLPCSRVHTALCTTELADAAAAITSGNAVIACGQEHARFAELAEELGQDAPLCVDIRDRAGWNDGRLAGPKMASLLAEALIPVPATPSMDVVSGGICLILGPAEVVFDAAAQLSDTLAVTVMLDQDTEIPLDYAQHRRFEITIGHLAQAQGTLGNFTLRIDRLQMLDPSGRGHLGMSAPRDGAVSQCDVILDLSGNRPLFSLDHKRDGYVRADPGSPAAIAKAVAEAGEMVGTFEKPLHIRIDPLLCAHSRAGQTGCTRCLDTCPAGAIFSDGETAAVDPLVCVGCGGCSSVCPSGAISYESPPLTYQMQRMQVLADTYRQAGGVNPRLLVHDDDHGTEMIQLAARYGRGLPKDVIPLAISSLSRFGHAEILAALAMGFADVTILLAPRTETEPLYSQSELARAMGAQGRLSVLDVGDPDAMSDALYDSVAPDAVAATLPMGSRRQIARLGAKALGIDQITALPQGAPYGAVLVDQSACTLCLSCVSLCPSGALLDNPDKPQLRFTEDACLQCGICETICPENAITLEPRFDPRPEALSARILHEEEPFCCISCGEAFGTASTVKRILAQLQGRHPMFADSDAGKMIQMCADCRVNAQVARNGPMAMGQRPVPRTTDDYLTERRDLTPANERKT